MRLRRHSRRGGFTLVELIVAAGLTLLIMAILATGFQAGLQSLSQLKSAGDLADRLRTAETLLRQDLDAPHFDGSTNGGSTGQSTLSNPGTLSLSDLRIDRDSSIRPLAGFFRIVQPANSSLIEGWDQDFITSTRATGHTLSLSVKRSGRTPGELFATVDPGVTQLLVPNPNDVATGANTFVSDWAEVHWFLDTDRPVVQNGVTTYPLCRRVLLLTKTPVPAGGLPATLREVVSFSPTSTNTPESITQPGNRLNGGLRPTSLPAGSSRFGDDIVITNVVSFEIKPTWEPSVGVAVPRQKVPASIGVIVNGDYPFDNLPLNTAVNPAQPSVVFDTAFGGFGAATLPPTPGAPPILPIRVTGVQIKIRVYDAKNKFTRQCVVTSKL